jgi:ABC transporter substrate binding protein (PQQ-dependent alcohol dehydrogenase system)
MKFVFSAVLSLCTGLAAPAGAQQIDVTYLQQAVPAPPVLSNLDPIPEDLGIAGARRGLADNATTGRFTGQDWTLEVVSVPPDGDFASAARAALDRTPFIVLDAPAQAALAAADLPEAAGTVLFNATATDSALRDGACRANLLHTVPSRAMLADALMQFLLTRRWEEIVLIEGTMPEDTARAAAYARAADKFGMQIGARKTWAFDADMRRNASREVPLFTQELGDYDILLVADEANDFARYIAYNTWRPRPVAGSEGLVPVAWDRVVEQWGAAQLQSRFEEDAGRSMQDEDYGAWAALRALGEAVTRTGSDDPATLRAYMLGPDFALAGFKGRPMTFRGWNGQLRQPIPLVTRSAVVANAPLEGFLHRNTELDTLGIDAPETACTAFD